MSFSTRERAEGRKLFGEEGFLAWHGGTHVRRAGERFFYLILVLPMVPTLLCQGTKAMVETRDSGGYRYF